MTLTRKFKRTKEDFTCEKCDAKVLGDGYTNHCPQCLWSKHVDVNPGDRAADCGGMMEPIKTTRDGDTYIILHQCTVCRHEKRNKAALDDNFDQLLQIAGNI